jgi:hypothetical protein
VKLREYKRNIFLVSSALRITNVCSLTTYSGSAWPHFARRRSVGITCTVPHGLTLKLPAFCSHSVLSGSCYYNVQSLNSDIYPIQLPVFLRTEETMCSSWNGNQSFLYHIITAHPFSLSRAIWIQSTPSHSISLTLFVISFSHLLLGAQVHFIIQGVS